MSRPATSRYAVPKLEHLPDDIHARILLDEEDGWHNAAIAALFALSNRMANVTGMRRNPEFYAMGRS